MDQDELAVETATIEDVASAQALIDGAREWLRSRGIDQWQDAVPNSVLVRDTEQGNLFVVRRGPGSSAAISSAGCCGGKALPTPPRRIEKFQARDFGFGAPDALTS